MREAVTRPVRRALVGAGAVLVGLGMALSAGPASAANSARCVDPVVWVNSGDYTTPGGVLRAYAIDPASGAVGAIEHEIAVDQSFGDIAATADGATLYGVSFSDTAPELFVIDPLTGSSTRIAAIEDASGVVVTGLNALTVTPDGRLYTGSYVWRNVWTLDPVSGVLELPYLVTYPTNAAAAELGSAGDVITLADGGLLALASDPLTGTGPSYLIRAAPDGSSPVIIGTVPFSFGMAQSNGWIYFASESGELAYLAADDLPTIASEDPITFAGSVSTGLDLWGATATGDVALGCPPEPAAPADPALAATGWGLGSAVVLGAGAMLAGGALVLLRRRGAH